MALFRNFAAVSAFAATRLFAAESISYGPAAANIETATAAPILQPLVSFLPSAGPLTRAVLTLERSAEEPLFSQGASPDPAARPADARPAAKPTPAVPAQVSPGNSAPARPLAGGSDWRALMGNASDKPKLVLNRAAAEAGDARANPSPLNGNTKAAPSSRN